MKTKLNLKNNQGMTLIELTVVILVLLSLISVLFIGAKAWKDGSDNANCIMNIRNFQTGARSYANLQPEVATPSSSVVEADVYTFMAVAAATCPKTKTDTYTASGTYGDAPGTVFLTCSNGAGTNPHAPTAAQSSNW
jgi:prepilin-type N-terminal cleavage/methylation domain-containing protein